MPPKSKSDGELQRQKDKKEYIFLVGVELFSRYAFVKWFKKYNPLADASENKNTIKTVDLGDVVEEDTPIVEKEAEQQAIQEDGHMTGLKATDVVKTLDGWLKDIEKLGYDLHYFISDEGGEFKNKEVADFLKKNKIGQVFTVPNDRVANPIAERFIGTFKRLFGQYTAIHGTNDITQDDVDKIVNFYNSRIHSSTDYTPDEVLLGDKTSGEDKAFTTNANTLFNFYRHQKGLMYHNPTEVLPNGTVVRIYSKWSLTDKNVGDKKSNIPNWSFTLFKIKGLNKADNHYILEVIGQKSPKDKKLVMPSSRGLRRELVRPIDYDAFLKYQ